MAKLQEPQFEADISIIDASELEKMKEKEKKIERIMWLVKENALDKDQEFMDAVTDAFDGIERDI